MPDLTISNLLSLLSVIADFNNRSISFENIKTRAMSKKNLHVTPSMVTRLCRLGYVRLETTPQQEHRYRATDDGRALLKLPLFERHDEFLRRKEVHPEGLKCCVCGYSGPGLTRFQKKDYCTAHLNVEYEPTFIYRAFSALSWET
jgi:hypothetical protein